VLLIRTASSIPAHATTLHTVRTALCHIVPLRISLRRNTLRLVQRNRRFIIRHAIHNCLRTKDIEQSQDYAVQRFTAAPAVEQDRAHGSRIDKRGGRGERSVQHFDGRVDGCGVSSARALADDPTKLGGRQVSGLRVATVFRLL